MPRMESKFDVEDSILEPIAIVGMACHLPGGVRSASSLWDVLENKKSVQTPKVPASRFNIDAHYHEDLERPGSFNVLGGYFLDGEVENFDPTFFNMTPIEAMWLDPQQRKILEVVYECFESAGAPLDSVAGTNTAVFVGSFTSDYQQMSIRDTDFRHNYAATGVDPGIISNRVGNAFNLNGPSFTINTACSSSVYATHNACHALRTRDCNGAIVAGVNLIITVDQHMNTAKLGILSPTSTCHTFDASADGYGRAEGAGALYLKRLSDAIRDGDPVRGVIRSSAVNTNGKVPSMGITHPSVKGQERVIRAAYERAGLDPAKTLYFELHGTGTPVGDPIEVRAVANAMNDTRSKDAPLAIGAIKANIGHSEAASGIFAVMKAALVTEAGVIPGVAGFKSLNPEIDEKGWNIKVHHETKPWPTNSAVRRASVNSFGYGGTNGHVIVEGVENLYPWYSHGKTMAEAAYDHSTSRPLLLTMSAHDKATLSRNIEAHGTVAGNYYAADLAYTLNLRRTRFPQRAFLIMKDATLSTDFAVPSFRFGSATSKPPQVGFMFTGQGAQWAKMGLEAMQTFPSFASTIKDLDQVLRNIPSPPAWTLTDALIAPEMHGININDAEITQPICTAIQIALVDILASWGIEPVVSFGHSSGEIGAAYSAGLISAPEAVVAAFYRGYTVKRHAPTGTMLAVGLGAEEATEYLSSSPDTVIACENSPSSVTLSGTSESIQEIRSRLDEKGVFARELRTGKAYHSPQMEAVAPFYNASLFKALQTMDPDEFSWRRHLTRMISSVTGKEIQGGLSANYWSDNLRNRVRFDSAVTEMGSTPDLADVKCIVEVGPHSALAGPFKQICKARDFKDFSYIPSFVRGEDSSSQLLKVAGELFLRNYPVDLERVNEIDDFSNTSSLKRSQSPSLLVDLPHYQWNYERRFFAESRASQEQRFMKYNRHDILGRRVLGLSDHSVVWRNVLRHRDIPWLKDHSLGRETLFPAAGHLSLAIEGLRQTCETNGLDVSSVTLRDVAIKVALVVPDTDDGIEIQLRLEQLTTSDASEGSSWYSFTVESIVEGTWNVHCEGRIAANFRAQPPVGSFRDISLPALTQRVTGKTWYEAFHRVGFEYGPSFQGLEDIKTNGTLHEAAADVQVKKQSGLMKGESRYILHPSTIDACLHLIIISIQAGQHKTMPWGVVPINIEEVSLWLPEEEADSIGQALAYTDELDGRYFNTHTRLATPSGKTVLDIKSLRCVEYAAALPQESLTPKKRQPYMSKSWTPEPAPEIQPEIDFAAVWANATLVYNHTLDEKMEKITGGLPTKDLSTLGEEIEGKLVICDIYGSLLSSLTADTFQILKSVLSANVPILWLTSGVNEGKCPQGAMVAGFLRAIRSEMAMAKIGLLDFDTTEDLNVLQASTVTLARVATKDSGKHTEFWLHDGTIQTCRLHPNEALNNAFTNVKSVQETILAGDQALHGKITNGELVFHSEDKQSDLCKDELEILVESVELESKNLQQFSSESPKVVTGRVLRVAPSLDSSMVGRKCVTYAPSAFSTKLTVPKYLCNTFEHFNSEDLAATLPSLCKVVNALIVTAKVDHSEQVLLLPAPRDFVKAAAKLSKILGLRLNVVVESEAEKDEYASGHGLSLENIILVSHASELGTNLNSDGYLVSDVVVAHDFSLLTQEAWRSSKPSSRFVLIDATLDQPPDVLPYTRGAAFLSVGVEALYKRDQRGLGCLLSRTLGLLNGQGALLTEKKEIIDIGLFEQILRTVKSAKGSESVIAKYNYGQSSIKFQPPSDELRFNPHATYLLVGCLGGLGRSLTSWMLERGAKRFAFLSRSGADKPEAAELVSSIEKRGAHVEVFRADASSPAGVARALSSISAEHPVRGVVHAAMVLQDSILETMTYDKWLTSITPKVSAAQCLHDALAGHTLDFFVMTSSISATLGTPGQSNYCAGNGFLDGLAWHRNQQGLPAVSLILPMILDVGYVAQHQEIELSLSRQGMYGIDEQEMLKGFETAMMRPKPVPGKQDVNDAQIILGLEPSFLAAAANLSAESPDAFWYNDARFSNLLIAIDEAGAGAKSSGSGGDIKSVVKEAKANGANVIEVLGEYITKKLSSILMVPTENFDYDTTSIADAGIDSMIGAELRNWLFKQFVLEISFHNLLAPTLTIKKLAMLVAGKMGLLESGA
ncbi:putative polyketide synthase [Mytilinidion resinicola]|uniref:Polyketide synthase n=1 Tax=Mytilinidion resinicola TaxID=574789 RepID=A0A6A6YRX3_9PEZI|nr:putative polyketide synthase [Mytilinidion resinicola]KAF2811308.1 putative polyketide synthase [Mytilinidion resinicola]